MTIQQICMSKTEVTAKTSTKTQLCALPQFFDVKSRQWFEIHTTKLQPGVGKQRLMTKTAKRR